MRSYCGLRNPFKEKRLRSDYFKHNETGGTESAVRKRQLVDLHCILCHLPALFSQIPALLGCVEGVSICYAY